MAGASNLFWPEAAIREALSALVADQPRIHIGSSITVVGTTDLYQLLPGVFVAPAAPNAAERVGDGVMESQVWDVTVAVPAVPDPYDLSKTYAALGELCAATIWALAAVPGLEYAGRLEPVHTVGHVETTLQFDLEITVDPPADGALVDFERFYADWDAAPADGAIDASDHINLPTEATP